jgi:sugar lactone lactonase YvrE
MVATSAGYPRSRRLIRPAKAPATVPPQLTGVWAPTDTRLDEPVLLPLPRGEAPEDVAVDGDGRLVAGGLDGQIWRWPAGAGAGAGAPAVEPEPMADTGGRPLGIEVDPRDGSLVVCDARRGLLRVREDGSVVLLADRAAGAPILFCNNAAVARDGTVYFTDSSSRYTLAVWKRDVLEHRANGRLLAYDPGSGRVDVVAPGLYFPNGVALTPDESAVLVAETSTHRLLRVPLSGPAAGQPSELVDLPAYPDNMSAVGDGTYWVALPSPRLPIAERLLPHPQLRRVAALLPDRWQPQPARYSILALVDGAGGVLRTMHGPAGRYPMLTGVRQHDGLLYLGSLTEPAVAVVSC